MDVKNKDAVEKILSYVVLFMRFITSWYVSPVWVFGLGVLLGQPIWICLITGVAFGFFSSKLWEDSLN